MTCDHCGKQVPAAVFCTNCGAHQGLADHGIAAQERPQHYAAHPGEHVAQPSIFTTLFPHLGHRKINEFRWALLLGFALVVVLVSTGLITAAVVVAILLVPTLYVVYLYEAQVYRDEPVVVLGATLGGGIVLGVAVTLISERVIGGSLGSNSFPVVSHGVVLPVIQLVVMPLPALLLRVLPQFRGTIDGLVFGVTAGVGFALAEGVVSYWSIFSAPPNQPELVVLDLPDHGACAAHTCPPREHGWSDHRNAVATFARRQRPLGVLLRHPHRCARRHRLLRRRSDPGQPWCRAADRPALPVGVDNPRPPVHPPSRPSLADGGGAGHGIAADRVPALPSPRDGGRVLPELWSSARRIATSRDRCDPGGAGSGCHPGQRVDGGHLRPLRHGQS